jgi:hypothetical protein
MHPLYVQQRCVSMTGHAATQIQKFGCRAVVLREVGRACRPCQVRPFVEAGEIRVGLRGSMVDRHVVSGRQMLFCVDAAPILPLGKGYQALPILLVSEVPARPLAEPVLTTYGGGVSGPAASPTGGSQPAARLQALTRQARGIGTIRATKAVRLLAPSALYTQPIGGPFGASALSASPGCSVDCRSAGSASGPQASIDATCCP